MHSVKNQRYYSLEHFTGYVALHEDLSRVILMLVLVVYCSILAKYLYAKTIQNCFKHLYLSYIEVKKTMTFKRWYLKSPNITLVNTSMFSLLYYLHFFFYVYLDRSFSFLTTAQVMEIHSYCGTGNGFQSLEEAKRIIFFFIPGLNQCYLFSFLFCLLSKLIIMPIEKLWLL